MEGNNTQPEELCHDVSFTKVMNPYFISSVEASVNSKNWEPRKSIYAQSLRSSEVGWQCSIRWRCSVHAARNCSCIFLCLRLFAITILTIAPLPHH